jgi:quercetin 2,3-dioxygenase
MSSVASTAQVFQLALRHAGADLAPGHEQKRFSAGDRRGGLCAVASPDARGGSLLLHGDAVIFSALLDPGQHVVHALADGRRAWLHLVAGEVTVGNVVLTDGDGAGVEGVRAASFTARRAIEVLLVELGAT